MITHSAEYTGNHCPSEPLMALVSLSCHVLERSRWMAIVKPVAGVGERWRSWCVAQEGQVFWENLTRCWEEILRISPPNADSSENVADCCREALSPKSSSTLMLRVKPTTWHDRVALRLAVAATFDESADAQIRRLAWQQAFSVLADWRSRCTDASSADCNVPRRHALEAPPVDAFFCPLGMLVLSYLLGHSYGTFVHGARRRRMELGVAERDVFGFDHGQLARAIGRRIESLAPTEGLQEGQTDEELPCADTSTSCELEEHWRTVDEHLRVALEYAERALGERQLSLTDTRASSSPATSVVAAHEWPAARAAQPSSNPEHPLGSRAPAVRSLPAPAGPGGSLSGPSAVGVDRGVLLQRVHQAASWCRLRQGPLTVIVAQPTDGKDFLPPRVHQLQELIANCVGGTDGMSVLRWSDQFWVILPCIQRSDAVRLARSIQQRWEAHSYEQRAPISTVPLAIGIATATVVSRNFSAPNLLEAAERCLTAANLHKTATIKSIDVL